MTDSQSGTHGFDLSALELLWDLTGCEDPNYTLRPAEQQFFLDLPEISREQEEWWSCLSSAEREEIDRSVWPPQEATITMVATAEPSPPTVEVTSAVAEQAPHPPLAPPEQAAQLEPAASPSQPAPAEPVAGPAPIEAVAEPWPVEPIVAAELPVADQREPTASAAQPMTADPGPATGQPTEVAKPGKPQATQPAPGGPLPKGFDEAQMRRFLRHLVDPTTGLLEFRVLEASYNGAHRIETRDRFGQTLSGYYDDPSALVVDALKLRGVSGYVCFNPADPSLKARSHNHLRKAKSTTSDGEVVCLRWLFLDVDSARPSGISATAAERRFALDKAARILADHPDLAAASLTGSSGNGAWILARLPDLENVEANRTLVAQVVTSISARYSDKQAKIDPPSKNASRIGPLVGTLKCKGIHLPGDREYSLVTLTHVGGLPIPEDVADEPALAIFDSAEWLARNPIPEGYRARGRKAAAAPAAQPPIPTGAPVAPDPSRPWSPPQAEGEYPRDVRLRRAMAYVDEIDGAVSGQGGSNETFDVACSLIKGFDLSIEDARPIIDRYNARCVPPWDAYELHHKLVDADEKEDDKPRGYLLDGGAGGAGGDGQPGDVGPRQSFSFSDLGNAYRLLAKYSHVIRYILYAANS